MQVSRRWLLQQGCKTLPALWAAQAFAQALPTTPRAIAHGKFQPTWDSLKQYSTPDWFRDAKFGIWAHWSAQCVPEQGDWYARQMYIQGHPQYAHHLKIYGHPTKFGFKEIDHLWKAERWQPEELMQLYVKAGAKYFVSLANHHDNFDNFDSRYHDWNSTRIGPMKDIVGTWAKAARAHGLRFGVSNHSAHSWHWFQTAYGYDPEGELTGQRYDAFALKKEDGKGTWWEGLDPQQLYTGPNIPMPDGITTIREANDWHKNHDRIWTEEPPPMNPAFVDRWFLRCQDLIDKYQPDLVYFDNSELPLGQAGLDITAHYYNSSMQHHVGRLEGVVNGKWLKPEHLGAVTLDIERGRANTILNEPWQSDTCIGDWHYKRSIFENHTYKTAKTVVAMLVDIVSRNGNLLLSIPVRGDGTLDEDEHAFLSDLAGWMQVNSQAIYGTRPFTVFGEGPPDPVASSDFNESKSRPLGAEDIRFTTKGGVLFATVFGWPESGRLAIKSLARYSPLYPKSAVRVEMLGQSGALRFTQDAEALTIALPAQKQESYAYVFKILS
jgi:alpha-L-fucosidase